MTHRSFRTLLPAALLALAAVSFVGCSDGNGGTDLSSSSSDDAEHGSAEFWEKQWQEALANANCPQPTDTIEGWKLAGLKTGVVPDNTDSNLVMQIREHDGTLIIRTYRGDMWTARFPELEWTHIYLPSRSDVVSLETSGDSVFANAAHGELWTAKFKDLAWSRISPDTTTLRRYPPETTRLFGEAAYQRGDTLFWAAGEHVTQEWFDKTNDYIKEVPIYASVNGKWFKTDVEWDTAGVKRDTSGTLPDGVWKFVETRGVLRALTHVKGIWEWSDGKWRKVDLLGRGETLPDDGSRPNIAYRDIVEHEGRVWIAEQKGLIESSPDMANWTNHWNYHLWQGGSEEAWGIVRALHPYKDKMLIGSAGGVLQWAEEKKQWVAIGVADCFEQKTTRALHVGYNGWGPPGLVHEFVILGDTLVAGVADYNYGLSGVYMFDLKEAN